MTSSIFTPSRLLVAIGAAGLIACSPTPYDGNDGNGGTVPGGNNNGDDDDVNSVQSALTGIVRDAMGQPLSAVTIEVDGLSGQTDANGKFFIEGVEVQDRVSVNAIKDGYARNSTPIGIIEDVENMVLITLAELDYEASFDAADGHSFEIEIGGPTVDLPAGGFVDADGNAFTGNVNVEATFYDLESDFEDGNELNATPGDFTAIDGNGEYQRLESYGMFQVNLTDDNGNELNVSTDAATVVPLQGAGYTLGEIIPMWHYDEVEGRWIEETEAEVIELADGTMAASFGAPHFSTWNVDKPLPTHGCVTGTVLNAAGTPRQGATVRAIGISYISTTTARTNQNGEFCLEVKNGETVWMEISYSVGGQVATTRTDPVTIPSGQGTCGGMGWSGNGTSGGGGSNCVSIGVVEMEVMSCISGLVVTAQGSPVVGATVAASANGAQNGGQAVTDSNGFFCITASVFSQNTVTVVETDQSGGQMGFVPTQVYTQPGMPECQGGCSNVVVLRPYTSTACASGNVQIGGQAAATLVEVFDLNFPEARVFSVVAEENGDFCVPIPAGVDVSVQVGQGQNLCDATEITAGESGQLAGAQCDSGGQGGECIDAGTLSCNP